MQEDADEIPFYRQRFHTKHLRVLKKDLPFVGYSPTSVSRKGYPWLYEMTFPLTRLRRKSEWAEAVLGREGARLDDVYAYYQSVLSKRGVSKKETRLALNELEHLVISRLP
jgi:hypothetical protein